MIRIKNTLSAQLLKSILIIYFLITFIVTVGHVVIDYSYTKLNIKSELMHISSSFTPAITMALWEMNQSQLKSISEGMFKIPLIYGIVIEDSKQKILINKIKPELLPEEIKAKELCYSFKIKQVFNGEEIYLAKITLYSDNSAVMHRLRVGFLMILLSAFIKSIALLVLFMLAFNKLLKRPLEKLTKQITTLNWSNPQARLLSSPFENNNELSLLQSKFSDLLNNISNLEEQKYTLVNELNVKLEEKVNLRTIELQKQKEEFETIFKTSIDGIAVLDLDLKFVKFNDAYLEMTGFSKEELLDKSCIDLIIPEEKEKFQKSLKELFEKGYVKNIEKTCIVKDKKRITVNMSLCLMPDRQRIIVSVKDITQSKILESQSKLAAMGEMIGNIAHQWRQPLSIISIAATGMKLQKECGVLEDGYFSQTCDMINNNAQYLSQTIDDFRDFIKGERVKAKFLASTLIESFLHLIEGSIKIHDVKIIVDVEDTIEIEGYQNELKQCFMNIYNNAKDILNENNKNEEKLFFIKLYKQNEIVNIVFKDNGGGIPNEILPKIFYPYFTTKHQSQGTGIGLHMTYTLITQSMQGKIEASNVEYEYNNKVYKGAQFDIAIPVKENSNEI